RMRRSRFATSASIWRARFSLGVSAGAGSAGLGASPAGAGASPVAGAAGCSPSGSSDRNLSASAWSKSTAISGTSAADGSAIAVTSPVTVGWASSPTPTRRCVARSGGGGYRRRSGGRRRRVRVRRHGGRQLLELLHVPADEVEVLGRGLFVAAHVVVLRGRLEHLVVGPGQELVRVRRHAVVQHLLELLFHEARDR